MSNYIVEKPWCYGLFDYFTRVNSDLQAGIDTIKAIADKFKQENDELKKEIEDINVEKLNLQATSDYFRAKYYKLQAEHADLRAHNDELQQENDELKMEIEDVNIENDDLQAVFDNFQGKNKWLQQENNDLKLSNAALQAQLDDMKAKNRSQSFKNKKRLKSAKEKAAERQRSIPTEKTEAQETATPAVTLPDSAVEGPSGRLCATGNCETPLTMPPWVYDTDAEIRQIQSARKMPLRANIDPDLIAPTQLRIFTRQTPNVHAKIIATYTANLQQHYNTQMPNKAAPNQPGGGGGGPSPQNQGFLFPMAPQGAENGQMSAQFYNPPEIVGGPSGIRPSMNGGQMGQPGGSNTALQDYQIQLMLLDQQCKKRRLMMARQEQDNSGGVPRADGGGGETMSSMNGGQSGQPGGINHALIEYQMQLYLLDQQCKKKRLMMVRQELGNSGGVSRADGGGGETMSDATERAAATDAQELVEMRTPAQDITSAQDITLATNSPPESTAEPSYRTQPDVVAEQDLRQVLARKVAQPGPTSLARQEVAAARSPVVTEDKLSKDKESEWKEPEEEDAHAQVVLPWGQEYPEDVFRPMEDAPMKQEEIQENAPRDDGEANAHQQTMALAVAEEEEEAAASSPVSTEAELTEDEDSEWEEPWELVQAVRGTGSDGSRKT